MSLPLYPLFMNTSPVHRSRAYENANAIPLMASEANKGSPSLFQALLRIAKHVVDKMPSDHVSVPLNSGILHTKQTVNYMQVLS
jgi:hypothetical protein